MENPKIVSFSNSPLNIPARLVAAAGYVELGLPEMALAELDGLPEGGRPLPEANNLRVAALLETQRWELAAEEAHAARLRAPLAGEFYFQEAFARHRLGRDDLAREILRGAPEGLRESPIFLFRLAHCEAVMGDREEARRLLMKSAALAKFLMEAEIKAQAARLELN